MTEDPLALTLLRHGRSRADDEGVHEGRYDSPLTAVGEAQAAKLAAYWLTNPPRFERVVCSSLVRARRTAEIIGEALGLTVTPDDAWREFDNGPLAGLTFGEAERRYPEPAFRHRFAPYTVDGGESYMETVRRINGALQTLVQSPLDRVLVVAHGGCINVALRDLLQTPVQTSFAFGDTSFSDLLVARRSDQVRLLSLNRTPHLTEGG
jgi:2,3-bisphosphoglycerate-dependent phosphoglycerate mutase